MAVALPEIAMVLERETKGALRYRGLGDDDPDKPLHILGTLYLRKAGLAALGIDKPAQRVTVKIEVET
jgi:hypothetical protein